MESVSRWVVKHKLWVLVAFVALLLLSAALNSLVSVNYDLVAYLPKDTPSSVAIGVMNGEMFTSPPNARVMVGPVTVAEALEYKRRIAALDGVWELSWLDDALDIYQPLAMMDRQLLDTWYKDDHALFSLAIEKKSARQTIDDIRAILGDKGEITGDAVNSEAAKEAGGEAGHMMVYLVPLILAILLVSTSSWFEPVLFLITIFAAIVLNNGTNAFFNDVSSLTVTTSAILQLAVSMDYAIFLLHRFQEFRGEGLDVQSAMIQAMSKSLASILASALTTILGFVALIFMRFRVGPDMGMVLAKGVLFSLLSVMLLLPVLTVYTFKLIDKTRHRPLLPSFMGFGRAAMRIGMALVVLIGIIIVPAYLAQRNNIFIYGASAMERNVGASSSTEQRFGKANNTVLMLPKGDLARENAINRRLHEMKHVSSVVSFSQSVGVTVPPEMVPEERLRALMSSQYSRMIITLDTEQESGEAFEAVQEIRALAQEYYADAYYFTGGSVNVYDMRETILLDGAVVTWVAIGGIAIILLFTFRSLLLPLILLFTIESSIWINLSITYFMGESMAYLGYLIISSVQLGATVDYAILFTNRYMENRRLLGKAEAASRTVSDTTASIATSALIMMIAGFTMNIVSKQRIIGQLGVLLGRGALFSAAMVLLFLPVVLRLLDGAIQKTTLGFAKEGKHA